MKCLAFNGNADIAQILLDSGASVDVKNKSKNGKTPLHIAASKG